MFSDGYLSFYEDDLFYYFVIARNSADGLFSTFNTLMVTNGYHPLWMAVLAVLACVVDPDSMAFFMMFAGILFFLTILAVFSAYRILRHVPGYSETAVFPSLLLFHFVYLFIAAVNGMKVTLPFHFFSSRFSPLDPSRLNLEDYVVSFSVFFLLSRCFHDSTQQFCMPCLPSSSYIIPQREKNRP